MTDVFSPAQRSQIMSRIRGKDTKPEILVRKVIHSQGFRYGLHRQDLPGTPDIVLTRQRKIIFVHGCFWHGHSGCSRAALPKSKRGFWKQKIEANQARDQKARRALRRLGWSVLVIWQCETNKADQLARKLNAFARKSTRNRVISNQRAKIPR